MPEIKNNSFSIDFSFLDCLSLPINFSANRKNKFYTSFGIIFSFCLFILFICLFFLFGQNFIFKIKPRVFKFEEILEKTESLILDKNSNLFIAFRILKNDKVIEKELITIKNSDLFQPQYSNTTDNSCINFLNQQNIKISEYFCFYLIGNYKGVNLYETPNNIIGNLKIYISTNSSIINDEINIELLMPIVIFNSNPNNTYKTDLLSIKYKKVTDVIIKNTVNRDILLGTEILKNDIGYFSEMIQVFPYIGVLETDKYERKFLEEGNIYRINVGLSQIRNIYINDYQKFQEVFAESACFMYFILIICKLIFYYPLNEMKKMYISEMITNVIEIEEEKKNSQDVIVEEGLKTNGQVELNNILAKISKFRSIKVSSEKSNDLIKIKREGILEGNNFRRASDPPNDSSSEFKNKFSSVSSFLNNVKNNTFKQEQRASLFNKLEVINELSGDNGLNIKKIDNTKKRNSVDFLSLKIHTINQSYENNDSNAVPLNKITKNKEENLDNIIKRSSELSFGGKNDLNLQSSAKFGNSNICENRYVKFSLSLKEICKKIICPQETNKNLKVKWSLYSIIKFYIEEKLDIIQYFELLNELKVLKTALLNPSQLLGMKNIKPFHIFNYSSDNSNNIDINYCSKNIERLLSELNFLNKEKNEEEMSLLSHYFSKNLFYDKMSETDQILLKNLNEDGISLIIRKLNFLKEDLIAKDSRKI
jgi:hypothetical protein